MMRRFLAALLALAVAAASVAELGWAQAPAAASDCDRCGKIESIKPLITRDQWTPLGSTTTGTSDISASGVTMHQIGKGFTNQGQVLLGAAGGGTYSKRPSELNAKRWEVVVRMDSGDKRLLTQNYEPMLHEGDRVRVMGSQLELVQ